MAKSDLISKTPEQLYIIDKDLNGGTGGYFVYMGYTTTDNPDEAIRGLTLAWSDQQSKFQDSVRYNNVIYNIIKQYDLNKGVDYNFIHVPYIPIVQLYYTKDKSAGEPLKNLYIEINGNLTGKGGDNWYRVCDRGDSNIADLNYGAHYPGVGDGAWYIYLWMQREKAE